MVDFGGLLSVAVLILLIVMFGTLAYGGILAAPWVPLWREDIERMLTLVAVAPGETVIDLGAGDGRIVKMAAGKFKAKAIGYEVALLPFLIGYITILLHPARQRISWRYQNFFKVDLSGANVICAFLTPGAMRKLKPKFEAELKPGTRVVSYAFAVPGWQPEMVDKPVKSKTAIYIYRR